MAEPPTRQHARNDTEERNEHNRKQRERRAAVKEQRAREIAERYVTSAELIESGWTRNQIKHLGEADLVLRVGWGNRYHWLRDRTAIKPPKRKAPTPIEVDVLAAIFTVNRAAKRYRDAAQSLYKKRAHGLSGYSKRRKEELYELKDAGIVHAYLAGHLQYCGVHGSLAIYRGEGYCFHSTLQPSEHADAQSGMRDSAPFFVEAKPKGLSESRLIDALLTLSKLPLTMNGFNYLEVPRHARPDTPRPPQFPSEDDDGRDEYDEL
jgi:hypothetical protein